MDYYVSSGEVSNGISVNYLEFMYVYSGGTANETTVSSGGRMYISSGGNADDVTVYAGGRLGGFSWNEDRHWDKIENGSAIVADNVVIVDSQMYVSSGGTATDVTINSGGVILISSGGTAYTTANNSGFIYVSSGGVANETTVRGGLMYVSDGGVANSTTVNRVGSMFVFSGGVASETTVNPYGRIFVSSGGVANALTLNGDHLYYGLLYVYTGGMANKITVNSNGNISVCSGGETKETVVNSGGYLRVYSGGTANYNTVNNSGYLNVSGGVVNYTTVSNGNISVSGGAVANATNMSDGNMYVRGMANSTTVNGGNMYVLLRTGAANSTTVNGGSMYVIYNGVAASTIVNSGGFLYVSNGGVVSKTIVSSGASMSVSSGGKVTGTLTTANGATIHAYAGSIIDFDISTVAPNAAARVNNWSLIDGSPDYTVTVSAMQAEGIYTLAGGAADFNSAVTLTVDDTAIGTLKLGGSLLYGVNSYTLARSDSALTLTVVDVRAEVLSVSADVTVPTLLDVTVTAEFNAVTVTKQYSFDGSAWFDYAAGVKMTDNGSVYFRGLNCLGNASEVVSYTVSNIDRIPPGKPTAAASITTPTNQNVTVTAVFSDDSVQQQYSLDGEVWSAYADGVVMTDNGMVYFRGIDAAGNISDVTSCEVTNIIPIVPETNDLNGDWRADVVMTITQVGHGAEGATGAWLIQADQTAVWGDLSQRNQGWEILGMGRSTAGKATNDVYLKSSDNIVGVWTTGANGKVNGWQTVGEFDASTQVLGLGDFDGDGQTDLLLRNTNGAVGCYLTGGEKTGWNYFQSLGDEWTISAIGDLNGDGRSDLVLKHSAGFAGSWLTQTDCAMVWANLDTLPEGFSIVGTGDFDGDCVDDVLLKNGDYYGAWLVRDGSVSAWMGLGEFNAGVTIEQIADFDGDGKDDLRIRTATGDLGVQLVKGADNLQWRYYGSVGDEWSTRLAAI